MELYRYFVEWTTMFSSLNAFQRRGLALWCSGVVAAEHCQMPRVAEALVSDQTASPDAIVRRLDRFLSNPRISDELLIKDWIAWVVAHHANPHWTILVDETKLNPRLSVMMVSLAYQQRAIPLLWHCYHPEAYPEVGQVNLIMELLERLRLLIPDHIALTVQADRGIGTSPDLIDRLEAHGWWYLLRVQSMVKVQLRNGDEHFIRDLVQPGGTWYGQVEAFKKAGWRRLYVRVDWRAGEKTPWCLVTNCIHRQSSDYRQRAWHEHSFRDLKSFGFNWHQSRIADPARAQRLILVLALAYGWVVSQAERFTRPERLSPSRQHPRLSIFKRGLRWVQQQIRSPIPILSPDCHFVPGSVLRC